MDEVNSPHMEDMEHSIFLQIRTKKKFIFFTLTIFTLNCTAIWMDMNVHTWMISLSIRSHTSSHSKMRCHNVLYKQQQREKWRLSCKVKQEKKKKMKWNWNARQHSVTLVLGILSNARQICSINMKSNQKELFDIYIHIRHRHLNLCFSGTFPSYISSSSQFFIFLLQNITLCYLCFLFQFFFFLCSTLCQKPLILAFVWYVMIHFSSFFFRSCRMMTERVAEKINKWLTGCNHSSERTYTYPLKRIFSSFPESGFNKKKTDLMLKYWKWIFLFISRDLCVNMYLYIVVIWDDLHANNTCHC